MPSMFPKLNPAVFITLFFVAEPTFAAQKEAGGQAPSGPAAYWGYTGDNGPEKWGDLSPAYALCKSGGQQSPIDINHPQQAGLANIETDYRAVPLHVVNNGHTIQVNYGPGSSMRVGNSSYELLQFHFHSPSENRTKGDTYPMEIHFVHRDDKGMLGVLAVFVKQGKKNLGLHEIWSKMPRSGGDETKTDDVIINGHDLLPENRDYYRFVGSLTTPPCTEGVQWHVLRNPIEASAEQIDAFLKIVGENARPVQPVGHRLLIDSAPTGASAH